MEVEAGAVKVKTEAEVVKVEVEVVEVEVGWTLRWVGGRSASQYRVILQLCPVTLLYDDSITLPCRNYVGKETRSHHTSPIHQHILRLTDVSQTVTKLSSS